MKERLGEEFQGTVTSVVGFGLFVTLDELHVEGLVHVTELGGEYFRFDELRQELRGDRSGMRYGVGTRVRVQVSRVDLDGRRIDFRMVKDAAAAWSASRSRASGGERPAPTTSVDLLAATLAEDRELKSKGRKTKAASSSSRKMAHRAKGAGKPKSAAAGGKRARRQS
jgi:ribonuclease R